MRVPTNTSAGPNDSRRRHAQRRPRQPSHSHKNWTYCRGTLTGISAMGAQGPSLEQLSASGAQLDPSDKGGQLTRAGRAYAKAPEVFGPTEGGPLLINEAGQAALDEVLTNPGTVEGIMQGGNFAGGKIFISPDGIGAVFSPSGDFEYFADFGK